MEEQIIRFVTAVSGNDIFFGLVRIEMVNHKAQRLAFIRVLLTGLDHNIMECIRM